MYLLLGSPGDFCCSAVFAALDARGWPARIVQNPTIHPARFSWRLDTDRSVSELAWDGEDPVSDETIDGVLIADAGWVDPAGWQPSDFAYIQAETQAAVLAWLWSLRCPVVNRYPADLWYRPQLPLLSWRPLLLRCGLPVADALVSNVEDEARAFGARSGAVYRTLSTDAHYLVASDRDWSGLAAMQLRTPVWLTSPHGQPKLVCVVGGRAVWNGEPPPEAGVLEPALRRFAAASGLAFVEVVLADVAERVCVVGVEHHPHFEHFDGAAQQTIVAALIELLTADASLATPLSNHGAAIGRHA
jgi:hypothetical protein